MELLIDLVFIIKYGSDDKRSVEIITNILEYLQCNGISHLDEDG